MNNMNFLCTTMKRSDRYTLSFAHFYEVFRVGFWRAAFLASSAITVMSACNRWRFVVLNDKIAKASYPSIFHRTSRPEGPSQRDEFVHASICISIRVRTSICIRTIHIRVHAVITTVTSGAAPRAKLCRTGALSRLRLGIDDISTLPSTNSIGDVGRTASLSLGAARVATAGRVQADAQETPRIFEAGNHRA